MVVELVDSGHVVAGECIVYDKVSDLICLFNYIVFFTNAWRYCLYFVTRVVSFDCNNLLDASMMS